MDKICRGSSIGDSFVQSPVLGAAGRPSPVEATLLRQPSTPAGAWLGRGALTPRMPPRHMEASPEKEGLSYVDCLSPRFQSSARKLKCNPPPKCGEGLDSTRGRRSSRCSDDAGFASPRSCSPTFRDSVNWMGYSSPERGGAEDTSNLMPSSNFSGKLRRQHSGKITQNSDVFLATCENAACQGSSVNSENLIPSRGKKTSYEKKASDVKGRLSLDSSQPEPVQSRRRTEFESPTAKGATVSLMANRSSSELLASVKPESCETPSSGEALKSARRPAPVCLAPQGGYAQKVMSMTNLRDHRSSEFVRELVTSQPAVATTSATVATSPRAQPPLSQVASARLAPTARGLVSADQRIMMFGNYSTTPLSMEKESAYLVSALHAVKWSTRSPGAFSPNAPRTPASQVLRG